MQKLAGLPLTEGDLSKSEVGRVNSTLTVLRDLVKALPEEIGEDWNMKKLDGLVTELLRVTATVNKITNVLGT